MVVYSQLPFSKSPEIHFLRAFVFYLNESINSGIPVISHLPGRYFFQDIQQPEITSISD
jgi:hypothetical protein